MYESSPDIVERLEPELRRRARHVANVLLRHRLVPEPLERSGPPAEAVATHGWLLHGDHMWHQEIVRHTRNLEPGDSHRLEEDVFHNFYLATNGDVVFESWCRTSEFRHARPIYWFPKSVDRFDVASVAEIQSLDFTLTSPYHNNHRRAREQVHSWSVERRRKPAVRAWGMGLSNLIDQLAAKHLDPATVHDLCPNLSTASRMEH